MNKRLLKSNLLYRATKGEPHHPDSPSFNCYQPVMDIDTSVTFIVDCWVCNSEGRIHPGYKASPVPIHVDNIGEAVKGQRPRGYR